MKGKEHSTQKDTDTNIVANKDIDKVLNYLNTKANKSFKLDTKENRSMVKRILTDYEMEGIKLVIDAKCSEWLDDNKYSKYLRPSTLFSKKNFKRYILELEPELDNTLTMQQKEHRAYLKTYEWKKIKAKVTQRANGSCEGCGDYLGDSGDVHHKTYDNFKNEFLFELLYLCRDCHTRVHGGNSHE